MDFSRGIKLLRIEIFFKPFDFRANIVLSNGITKSNLINVAAALLFLLSLVAGVLLKSKFHSKIALFSFSAKTKLYKTTVSAKMVGTLWGVLVPSMLVYKIW